MTHSLDTPTSSSPSTSDVARDEARSVGQSTAEAGKQVAGTAAEQAQQVTQETRRQAQDLLAQGRSQASEQARNGQQKAADSLGALADELRSMTGGDGSGPAHDLVQQATGVVDQLAGHLRDREPGDLLEDVRSFARRRPGVFLLGAAVAGIVAGRLTTGVVAAHKDQSGSGSAGTAPQVAGGSAPLPGGGGAAAGYAAVPPVLDAPSYATADPAYGTDPAYRTDPAYGTEPAYGSGPGYDPASGYTPVPPAPYGTPTPAVPPTDPSWDGDRPLGGGQA